jgi:hypothetical protein
MRLVLGGVAGALALAVAACNSSGSTPTPSPTPTPTPTPTGTPTPAPTPTPVTFTTSESGLQYTLEGGVQRVANTTALPATMGNTFRFTPDQNGYSYVLLNGSVNPTASETAVFPVTSIKTCDRGTLCFGGGAFVFQQVAAPGGGNYYLSRLIPGSNPLIQLTYIAFGMFEEAFVDPAGGPRTHVDLRAFAYGSTSPATGIPTTGTNTFVGALIGQATGNKPTATGTSNVYRISGNYQLVANWPAGTATLKLNMTGVAQGCTTCPANFNQTVDATNGTIAAGVVSFPLTGGNARFFLGGPTASESGGSFVLTLADPNEAGVTMTLAGSGAGSR